MKLIHLLSILAVTTSSVMAQGELYVRSSGSLTIAGGGTLTLNNAKLTNNGSVSATSGTLLLRGGASSANSALAGAGNTTLQHLTVDKSSNAAQLDQNITVTGSLSLNSGGLNLNGGNVNFGATGSLQNESATNAVFGTGGELIATPNLNAPSGSNPANLGLVLTSSQNLGSTTIKRGHSPYAVSQNGIMRYYDIAPSSNTGLNATLRFAYFDSELNGNNENTMLLWKSDNGGTSWVQQNGTTTRDVTNNFVQLSGLGALSRFTVANPGALCTPPSVTITGTTSACGTVTLTASGGDSYVWSGGNSTTSGTNTFGASSSYTVTVSNASNCTATASVNITVTPLSNNTTTATACDSYTWSVNGITYGSSGSFTFVNNCLTETLNLTITPSSTNTTTATACDSYVWNGVTYTSSGSYSVTNACVTDVLNVTITPSSANTTTATACDSYVWNGVTYTSSGSYSVTNACVTNVLNVTITPSSTNTTTATACDSYVWNGVTYTSSGSYSVTNACVTDVLNVTITPSSTNTVTATACDSYVWNGVTYTSSGSYSVTNACVTDVLNVTITPSSTNTVTATACDSYVWNGVTYTSSGSYSVTNACVTDVLNVTITPSSTNTVTATACDSYVWNGVTYTSSGSYSVTNACVTDVLNVTITPSSTNTVTATACDSYVWNGVTYTSSGSYSVTNACVTNVLNVTITPNSSTTATVSACESYTWPMNGQTYTSTGVYAFVSGCGTQTLILTINIPIQASITASNGLSFCPGTSSNLTAMPSGGSFAWSTGASAQFITVNSSGSFTTTVTDANNCTSTASFTTTVTDTQAPSIICPANQPLAATGAATLPNYASMATATDNCSGVTVTQLPAPGSVFTTSGVVNVTLTANDASMNLNSCSFDVNITVTPGQAYTTGGDQTCNFTYVWATTLGVPSSQAGTVGCYTKLGNNIGATSNGDPTNCGSAGDKGVWYYFRMPCGPAGASDTRVRISTNNAGTTLAGTSLGVYTVTSAGSCVGASHNLIACSGSSNVAGCSGPSVSANHGTLEFGPSDANGPLQNGGAYYVYVSGDNGTEGNFELTFEYVQNGGITVTAGTTPGQTEVTVPNNGQSGFRAQWRPMGAMGWATSPLTTGFSYTLPANTLMPGVNYEYRALYDACLSSGFMTMASPIVNFATTATVGTCAPVSGLSCDRVGSSVTATWGAVPAGTTGNITVALRNGSLNLGGRSLASTVTSTVFANVPTATSMQVQSSCGGAAYIATSNCTLNAASQQSVEPVSFEFNGISYEGIDFNDANWGLFGAQPEGEFTMSAENGQLVIRDANSANAGFDFELRPSVATDFTNVVISTQKTIDAHLNLSDMNGTLISSQTLKQVQNGTIVTLETSELPAGLYIVSVRTEEGNVAKKLVVVK